MKEIFELSFSAINIIPTILLIFVVLYWIVVLFGLIDLSSLDINLDTDIDTDVDIHIDADVDIHIDADVDVHADVDTDIDGGDIAGGHGFVLQSLAFFNVGKVPLMLLLSFIAIPFWFLSLTVNYYLQNTHTLISLILLIPEFFISLFIAKVVSTPIANVFSKIEKETGQAADYTGITAEVRITVERDRIGQIELNKNGSAILLNAISVEGIIKTGEKILIVDYIKEKNYYLVEPF